MHPDDCPPKRFSTLPATLAPVQKPKYMTIHDFFALAINSDWRMNWVAWKLVCEHLTGLKVVDDDSHNRDDTHLNSGAAKDGMFACTLMPTK